MTLLTKKFDIDIRDLCQLEDVATSYQLGPNSSFLMAFDVLLSNLKWLENKITSTGANYFIFDCPGQLEIFTVSDSFKTILNKLSARKGFDMRLAVVNLIESVNLTDLSRYVFSIFAVLNSMIMLELPQVNVSS